MEDKASLWSLNPSKHDGYNVQNVADENDRNQRHEDVHDVLLADPFNAELRPTGRSGDGQERKQVNPPRHGGQLVDEAVCRRGEQRNDGHRYDDHHDGQT